MSRMYLPTLSDQMGLNFLSHDSERLKYLLERRYQCIGMETSTRTLFVVPIALQVPVWSQQHEAVCSRNVHKARRNGSVAGQLAALSDAILLEELQRAVHEHDANVFSVAL